jgi:hypothetical protein
VTAFDGGGAFQIARPLSAKNPLTDCGPPDGDGARHQPSSAER